MTIPAGRSKKRMSRRVRITLIQFDDDEDDPRANLEMMKQDVIKYSDSDLIVFPELALHGHDITHEHTAQIRTAYRAVTDAEIAEFHDYVREQGVTVIYGELIEKAGKLYNLATFSNGRDRISYAKTHVHWSEPFEAGTEFPVVPMFDVPIGMLICFDAAFPEVPRALALNGAKLIVNISAIPEHFPLKYVHRRLVACSMENQVFTLFANRIGDGFLGGSAVIDPRGETIAVADDKQEALTVEINLREVDEWREEEPLLANRRPHLYSALSKP